MDGADTGRDVVSMVSQKDVVHSSGHATMASMVQRGVPVVIIGKGTV